MENIAIVLFNVESEGYQAFAGVEKAPITPDYSVSQFDLVKREGDSLVSCNHGDSGVNTTDDMLAGGLVGMLIGILGGPIGMLLGSAYGATMGMAFDAMDAANNASLTEMAATKLYEGEVALIALVQEESEEPFNALFDGLDCTIIRRDAAEVSEEVEEAIEAQKELQRQAKAAMRAQRKADRQQRIDSRRASIKEHFEEIKTKYTEA